MDSYQITMINLSKGQLEEIVQNAVRKAMDDDKFNKVSRTQQTIWLSRAEAAAHLKISLPTLDSLAKKGVLVAYRTGRKVRFNLEELNLL